MISGLVKVAPDLNPPEATEVAIIGGGIVGTCTALFLAERGIPVCLFEKGEIAAEQSGRNWGWVRKMGRGEQDIALAILADDIWPTLAQRTGEQVGYRRVGALYPCDTEAELAEQSQWRDRVAVPAGVDSRLLDARQTAALLPGCVRDFKGALHTPSDGSAEPFWAAPGIAQGARKKGARIFTRCAVRGLEYSAGRVSGVITEQGRVACNSVIIAAGAWSRQFLQHIGVRLPQLRLRASVRHVEGVDLPDLCVSAKDLSFRKRMDGTLTFAKRDLNTVEVGPDHLRFLLRFLPMLREQRKLVRLRIGGSFFEAMRHAKDWNNEDTSIFEQVRVLGKPGEKAVLDRAQASLCEAFAELGSITPIQDWSGYIEATPDGLPVIGPVTGRDGALLATGFSGHGFGIGPAVAQLLAQMVGGEATSVPLRQFQLHRFAAG